MGLGPVLPERDVRQRDVPLSAHADGVVREGVAVVEVGLQRRRGGERVVRTVLGAAGRLALDVVLVAAATQEKVRAPELQRK